MRKNYIFLILLLSLQCSACNEKKEVVEKTRVKVPVTIIHPIIGPIAESLTLTATSSYQRKNIVSAQVLGYIVRSDVAVGDHVTKGQSLFILQTKEAHALNNSNIPDSLKAFSGQITIPASASGIVTSVSRQAGDYVQDGEQLCTIADIGSFAFILSVPYDYIHFVKIGESCELQLPDSTRIFAQITKKLSTIDAASQTQNYLLVPSSGITIPENIIAQVKVFIKEKTRATILPKQTVLSDETMQNFWVMQLLNDSLVMKVSVEKGIETDESVEITSPAFSTEDRFVLTGNYGMEDSTLITTAKKSGE